MKFFFKPKTNLEKFGFLIYKSLVENFPKTFFVGGTVRNFLLKKTTSDIDISTEAKPEKIYNILVKNKFKCDLSYKQFGTVIVSKKNYKATITSFRKDIKYKKGYPKIKFVNSPKIDAKRRDFTINALYFSPETNKIIDFYNGITDIKNKKITFIGNTLNKIKEDPLRIIRAIRFALVYNLKIKNNDKKIITSHFKLILNISQTKIKNEVNKINNSKIKNQLLLILQKKYLDNKFNF